jgi:hypothetical protein
MVKEIICSKGEVVLCDDEDYPLLSRFSWFMAKTAEHGEPYAFTNIMAKNGKHKRVPMQQLVMGGASGVDHKDHNTSDNRKENLRDATYQQNGWNKGKARRCRHGEPTSKYKGVSYSPFRGRDRWFVSLKYVKEGAHKSTGKVIRVGYFWDEDDAARAYNAKVKELRGEWAWINPVTPPFPVAA